MPYAQMPWVRNGRLLNGVGKGILVDSEAWFAWLTTVTSFCYSGQDSWVQLTVRQEKRRSRFYWYAYSKIDAKLHNIYLGSSTNLTRSRLDHACQRIYQRARDQQARERRTPAKPIHSSSDE